MMDWMWGIKERGSEEDTKVFGQGMWQNGVATYQDGETVGAAGLAGEIRSLGTGKFAIPIRHH